MLRNLLQDVRSALRQLRQSPGSTRTVVLMLALGIGDSTAVFSVLNAILMQLLPVSRTAGLTPSGSVAMFLETSSPVFRTGSVPA